MFSPSLYHRERKIKRALIVDDEDAIRHALRHFMQGRGYEVVEAGTGQDALATARSFLPDMVFLDRKLPDCDGEDLLRVLTSPEIGALVVMMTAYVEFDKAISAMRNGAEYYFPKPLDLENIAVILGKVEEKMKLCDEVEYFKCFSGKRVSHDNILGNSAQIITIRRLSALLARNVNTPVLILGESGSGKEVVAKSIHLLSGVKGQMVEVNCASLSEHLLESELFGHEQGAFTDARNSKKGLFEIADGGTIFFDEVAEMPLVIQAKLLKVLDSKTFRKVGGVTDIRTSARFMAATNKDLDSMVRRGLFREDLFYRISVFPIHVPPLRSRDKDIALLSSHFAATIGESMGKGRPVVSPEALHFLQTYNWPGNVRELKNVIERALILSPTGEILPNHLAAGITKTSSPGVERDPHHMLSLSQVKQDYIQHVLEAYRQQPLSYCRYSRNKPLHTPLRPQKESPV